MSQPFDVTELTRENWEPIFKAKHKEIGMIVYTTQLRFPEGFSVSGMYGRPYDYVIEEETGKKYPCMKKSFDTQYELLGRVQDDLKEIKRPIENCQYGHDKDGCCFHPENMTPECFKDVCPLLPD